MAEQTEKKDDIMEDLAKTFREMTLLELIDAAHELSLFQAEQAETFASATRLPVTEEQKKAACDLAAKCLSTATIMVEFAHRLLSAQKAAKLAVNAPTSNSVN